MSAREAVVATIRDEHRSLGTVMEALQRLLADVAAQHAEPDFALFSAALCYIADFPERCHHPKEDEYLFEALRRSTADFNAVLDELQAEHIRGAHMLDQLQRALVHYQGGDRREEFRRLYVRVFNLLPRRLKKTTQHARSER